MCPSITISISDMIWGKLERPEMRHRLDEQVFSVQTANEIPNFASALYCLILTFIYMLENGNFHHKYNHCQPESIKQIKTIPKISLNIRQFDVKKGKPNLFRSVVKNMSPQKVGKDLGDSIHPFLGCFDCLRIPWLHDDPFNHVRYQKRPYTPGTWSCFKTFVWTSFTRP